MKHETKWRVQYYETDAMGVVHHSNYIRYFETARTEAIRGSGYSYDDIEHMGIFIPVLSVEAKFKTPAVYDEEIVILCWMKKMGAASFEMAYEVRNAEDGTLHVTGTSRHGFTDKSFKPVAAKRAYPEIYQALETLLVEE